MATWSIRNQTSNKLNTSYIGLMFKKKDKKKIKKIINKMKVLLITEEITKYITCSDKHSI